MSVSKYDVLKALVDSQAREQGDEAGWHHVVASIIDVIASEHGSEFDMSEEIYEVIATAIVPGGDESENQVNQT